MHNHLLTLDFHGTPVAIVDHDGRKWLTAEQVGLCLGYSPANASAGIRNLYNRHMDEFTAEDTCRINLMRQGQLRESLIFSATGCQLLGFFANTDRAKAFRAWAKSVLAGAAVSAVAPIPPQPGRTGRAVIDRRIELDVLTLFVQGWAQSAIAKHLRISPGTVSLLVHARWRFNQSAGHDLTTPALRQAVVERHISNERARLTQKYCASAVNTELERSLDAAGMRLLGR